MEIAAKTLVKLALLPGSKGAESFEFDIKRAFEWLAEERNEGKRHAAVLVLRELAVAMPTFFYQQVSGFFEHIFKVIHDPKPIIRDGAGQALRAALVVTSQREVAKQLNKPQWYQQCFEKAMIGFGDEVIREKGVTKDDRIHGSLIVLNELLRCSNLNWERRYCALRALHPEPLRPPVEEFSTGYLPMLKAPFIQHSQPPVYTSNPYDLEFTKYSQVRSTLLHFYIINFILFQSFSNAGQCTGIASVSTNPARQLHRHLYAHHGTTHLQITTRSTVAVLNSAAPCRFESRSFRAGTSEKHHQLFADHLEGQRKRS